MLTFRDLIRRRSPVWLRGGTAEKVLFAVGVHLDGLIDAMVASVKMRFPGYYSDESLPFESRQRGIYRGRHETAESFAGRLIGWWDAHRRRGNPYELLRQIHAHFAPNNFPIELVYASGRRFSMAPDGTITWDHVAWVPPGDPGQSARWWLFYHHPPFAVSPGSWNDGTTAWSAGQVWGSGLSPADVADLKLIPVSWGNAESIGHLVLLDDGESWDTYEPGEWPRQIALEAMTDPLIPVDSFDIDTIVPPVGGQFLLAEVVETALQKVVNALFHLKSKESSARFTTAAPSVDEAEWSDSPPGSIPGDGWTLHGTPATRIQAPAPGRYWVSWSAVLQSSDDGASIRFNALLYVGSSAEGNAMAWRHSTNTADMVMPSGGVLVEITDPANQRIRLLGTAVKGGSPTTATINQATVSLMRVS